MLILTVSNESELRKKLLEIHDDDTDAFDSISVLALIERISSLVQSEFDTQNGHTDNLGTSLESDHSVPSSLRSLLPKISCVLSCECWGGDVDASTMKIMKLLSKYRWEAKLAIVLASFAVDYAQFSHATKLYKNNAIGDVVAMLMQIPADFYGAFNKTKSTFTVITEASIKVTRIIAEFSKFSSKYISNQVEAMAAASNQFPIIVYNITKVVVATTASRHTEILGQSEISSYAETWDGTRFEKEITRIHEFLWTQLNCCNIYIEEEKQKHFFLDLKRKFNGKDANSTNQKILQLMFNTKDCLLPLESARDKTSKTQVPVWVEDFKGKTVLLFISDLDISYNEISILIKLYQESRNNPKYQYEIVWLPIVGKVDQDEESEQKFTNLKLKMPWYSLLHLKLLKPAVERYVKEEWHYSKKWMLVALDPQGRVANLNAYQTMLTWGNTGFPFTHSDESDAWCRAQWSLELLVRGIDETISTWIEEKKVICLYGGPDEDINNFIKIARAVLEKDAAITLEMAYIGEGVSENLTEILKSNGIHFLKAESAHYFWKRIEGMVESHHGAKVSTTKETILGEVRKIHKVIGRQGNQSWALISQGAGLGTDKMAYGELNWILRALTEFENWKTKAEQDFVTALNDYLASLSVCKECGRPLN